ncbi:calcium-binding protein [Nostoc sp. XA010]|uniref:beta strand repeat-containing protein n=1 Tax=Nostoc sp. XA010 TaxID=2780407 RepID=UPI001E4A536A|nr:calcium-binding protein [Nostoc sp. XA010]MCC5661841.1 calcium-binding protein [Nostoc sp. XA010]
MRLPWSPDGLIDFRNPISGSNTLNGGTGDDRLNASFSTGNNQLSGGTGEDILIAYYSTDNNQLSGGTGNDSLSVSGGYRSFREVGILYASGSNTLNGDAGDDRLDASLSTGNNTLNGGTGNDTLNASVSSGNNLLNGGDGNDFFYVTTPDDNSLLVNGRYPLVTQTVDGGIGDDLLSGYYSYASKKITSTFNATTNSGSITADMYRVNYKNIERLNITGTQYDDLIVGSNGNDTLSGAYGGNDTIDGGKGNDLFSVDYFSGNFIIYSYDSSATGGIITRFNATTNSGSITAGTKNRISYKNIEQLNISGTDYNDLIIGNNGNDTLSGGYNGNDTIDGGKGNDLLSVFYNSDEGITTTFNATTNIGSITAGTNGVSYKNIEQLNIIGTQYDDLIVGSNGNDTLSGYFRGNDTIDGGKGNDTIDGVSGNGIIDGGKGDDLLSVSYSSDDKITTTFNPITNIGSITGGKNRVSYENIERLNISGSRYDDLIVGNNGNDTLSGGYYGGNDTIDGGKGDDLLSVDYSNYVEEKITSTFNATSNIGLITAGTARISYKFIEQLDITGTQYDDLIVGSNGNDTLKGGYGGNDTLTGGKGNDSLIGGSGIDSFAFNNFTEGVDRLDDFKATNELIQVSAAGFGGGLSSGTLFANKFTIGASATTNQERFIYNSATGGLFFDLDGSASGFTQVQFAQLSTGLSLTEKNFVVV